MKKYVVLDLETAGKWSNAIILSAGATWGVYGEENSIEEFRHRGYYAEIDVKSCLEIGMTKDDDVMEFWSKQSAQSKSVLMPKPTDIPILELIPQLKDWMKKNQIDPWSTDFYDRRSFDFSKLQWLCEEVMKVKTIWNYRDQFELATMFHFMGYDHYGNIKQSDPAFSSLVYHNSLDDAIMDAIRVQKVMNDFMRD